MSSFSFSRLCSSLDVQSILSFLGDLSYLGFNFLIVPLGQVFQRDFPSLSHSLDVAFIFSSIDYVSPPPFFSFLIVALER